MNLTHITWGEAHWLRYAVVVAAKDVAEGSLAHQSFIGILSKLNQAEHEALEKHGVNREEILQTVENRDPTLLNPDAVLRGDRHD